MSEVDYYFLLFYVLLEHGVAAAFAYQGVSDDFLLSEGLAFVKVETLGNGEMFGDYAA